MPGQHALPWSTGGIPARLHAPEAELQAEPTVQRRAIGFAIEDHRRRLAPHGLRRRRLRKVGLLRLLLGSRWRVASVAPVGCVGVVPFAAMDLFVTAVRRQCVPVFGIPRVRRRDAMVFDRSDLPCRSVIERIRGMPCADGTGVAALRREVAARTGQQESPIKHTRRLPATHARSPRLRRFGDGQAESEVFARLRHQHGMPALARGGVVP